MALKADIAMSNMCFDSSVHPFSSGPHRQGSGLVAEWASRRVSMVSGVLRRIAPLSALCIAAALSLGGSAAWADGGPFDFYRITPTIAPCRVFDSRLPADAPPLSGNVPRIIQVTGVCGVPASALAVAVNLTVVNPTGGGNLVVYGGASEPATSNLNFRPGVTAANNAIVELAVDGTITAKARMGVPGTVDLIVDVSGYFQVEGPVLTPGGATATFTEDGPAVVVDPGITVTDMASPNLVSATVTITNPLDGAAEVLAATSCAGLTVTPGLNSLSITGTQPLATYETCLQSVTYQNTSQDPDITPRSLSYSADDGTSTGGTTETVNVTASNDAPVVTTTAGTTSFTEDGGPVVVDSGVMVSDADDTNLVSATVSLVSAPDGAAEVLNATNCGALTVAPGNPLAISGTATVAVYQTCLQSVTYDNSSQSPDLTNRTVSFVADDGTAASSPATKTVSVAAANDAPVVTTTVGTTVFTEGGGPVVVDSGVTVSDADNTNLASATVSLVSAPDGAAEVLNATNCGALTVAPGNPLAISGTATVAVYQTCLQSVTYDNTSQNPDTA